ncbi:MAG TPA: hypothetical protein VMF06_14180 [Candidatus Limnocylindria bacterium]|nr:hypothetical protein [Candidatus Limnocylindria bacterium]
MPNPLDDEANPAEMLPDPSITQEIFHQWSSPRFGQGNPERMNNPVWEWLVRSRINAYSAAIQFNEASALEAGPGWCFDRFGQSSTVLPDGRVVLIAGEHEDHYDPDFKIYNDVVILHPDGKIDILGYPPEVFPPTDFHTATQAGNRIIIIGSLGYLEQRKPRTTPVAVLDLETFAISLVDTSGRSPGWLHSHTAELAGDGSSILVQGGKLYCGQEFKGFQENNDDWKLHLADWRWEQVTHRCWPCWLFARKDGNNNHIAGIRMAKMARDAGLEEALRETIDTLTAGCGPAFDFSLLARLYRPALPHTDIGQDEKEANIHRISVDGVIIRYIEEASSLQMIVEGDLSQESQDALVSDLVSKLSALENDVTEAVRV